jgi:predicted transcriptional regulator
MRSVLETINSGETKPSRIMLYANVSWDQLTKVLKTLIEKEYINLKDESKRSKDKRSSNLYEITKKGRTKLRELTYGKEKVDSIFTKSP